MGRFVRPPFDNGVIRGDFGDRPPNKLDPNSNEAKTGMFLPPRRKPTLAMPPGERPPTPLQDKNNAPPPRMIPKKDIKPRAKTKRFEKLIIEEAQRRFTT